MKEEANGRDGEVVYEDVLELNEEDLDAISGGEAGFAKLYPVSYPPGCGKYMVYTTYFDREARSFRSILSSWAMTFDEALDYVDRIAPGSRVDVQKHFWRGLDRTPGVSRFVSFSS